MSKLTHKKNAMEDDIFSDESELFSDDNFELSDEFSDCEMDEELLSKPNVKQVANVMKKILDNKESNILSKSKQSAEEQKEDTKITKKERETKAHKKAALSLISRTKPDLALDHEKERKLKILATQGVVQLFTTVEKHKLELKQSLASQTTQHQKSKVIEDLSKDKFMKRLNEVGEQITKEEIKVENSSSSNGGGWNVLSKKFYDADSEMKNWDEEDSDKD